MNCESYADIIRPDCLAQRTFDHPNVLLRHHSRPAMRTYGHPDELEGAGSEINGGYTNIQEADVNWNRPSAALAMPRA